MASSNNATCCRVVDDVVLFDYVVVLSDDVVALFDDVVVLLVDVVWLLDDARSFDFYALALGQLR